MFHLQRQVNASGIPTKSKEADTIEVELLLSRVSTLKYFFYHKAQPTTEAAKLKLDKNSVFPTLPG